MMDERERQQYFIDKVRVINEETRANTGKTPLYFVKTYGCQMNERDSEKIVGTLEMMGFEPAAAEKQADFVIYNTCCIRENAENKVFGNLGILKHYKEQNKNLKIALCGCMVQKKDIVGIIASKYKHVDILFGTFNFHRLAELLHRSIEENAQIVDIWEHYEEQPLENVPTVRKCRHKAGVNIMYGCDNYCAYCIVPYVRGREQSRSVGDIVAEIQGLCDDGVKEILLLGQNVNSYGKNGAEGATFAGLLEAISDIKWLERIRFMTPHPKDVSDELLDVIAGRENICNHIHLPLQSGSTSVLRDMNRKYTKEDFLTLCDKIRRKIPNVTLTTDIIVGFPTETEDDFAETLDVVSRVKFNSAYTFIYSKRAGTAAAKLADIDPNVVKERFGRLLKLQNDITCSINESYVGRTFPVLADEAGQEKEVGCVISGRTEGGVSVHFSGKTDIIGTVVQVKITRSGGFFLEGEALQSN